MKLLYVVSCILKSGLFFIGLKYLFVVFSRCETFLNFSVSDQQDFLKTQNSGSYDFIMA